MAATLATKDTWATRAQAQLRGATRNHIDLPGEVRHPEAVDDIGGFQRELDLTPDRDANFVGAWNRLPICAYIGDAPPPLFADHLDTEHVSLAWRAHMRPCEPQIISEQCTECDAWKCNASNNHGAHACQARADCLGASDREPQGTEHNGQNRHREGEQNPAEMRNVRRAWATRCQHGLAVAATAQQDQDDCRPEHCRCRRRRQRLGIGKGRDVSPLPAKPMSTWVSPLANFRARADYRSLWWSGEQWSAGASSPCLTPQPEAKSAFAPLPSPSDQVQGSPDQQISQNRRRDTSKNAAPF